MTEYSYENNKEFNDAYNIIKNTNNSVLITGKAGTGKSSFIRYITSGTIDKNFLIVAPTGIAAINIRGVTIHSFFNFPPRPILPNDECLKFFRYDLYKKNILKHLDAIIIDEISMVRADIIDAIDNYLRIRYESFLPFAGKQMIFIGDIFQLEPIVGPNEYEIISSLYPSPYFFSANAFKKIKLIHIELTKIYRQKDIGFIQLLDKIRLGEASTDDLDVINKRVYPYFEPDEKEYIITLTTINDIANNFNRYKLQSIQQPLFTYEGKITNNFDKDKLPTEQILNLKKDTQVIFIRNDTEHRWVNGTIAKIYNLSENSIEVIFENGNICKVEKELWENVRYTWNKEKNKIETEVIGSFQQYPLKLAWALTIHKSQGLTFDKIIIDIGRGAFASGQLYVALSRCRSLEGIFLKKKMSMSDIIVDNDIIQFYINTKKNYNSFVF
jgi:ATP-dependent exoDNAse (exonuclease V) alpha subunit